MNEKYEEMVLKLRNAGKESFLFGDLMRDSANTIEELWQMFHSAEMDNIKLTNMYAEQVQKNKQIHSADVRPVVYCKECKHRPVEECRRIIAPKYADGYTDYKCPFLCDDPWYNRMPTDDYYCSSGEKREES